MILCWKYQAALLYLQPGIFIENTFLHWGRNSGKRMCLFMCINYSICKNAWFYKVSTVVGVRFSTPTGSSCTTVHLFTFCIHSLSSQLYLQSHLSPQVWQATVWTATWLYKMLSGTGEISQGRKWMRNWGTLRMVHFWCEMPQQKCTETTLWLWGKLLPPFSLKSLPQLFMYC